MPVICLDVSVCKDVILCINGLAQKDAIDDALELHLFAVTQHM